MTEDPKTFLKDVKSGIGESADGTVIDFEDAVGGTCRLTVLPGDIVSMTSLGGRILLNSGQAKRLANTLERFATAHNLGNPGGS